MTEDAAERRLCHVDDIAEGGAKGLEHPALGPIFLVRKAGRIHAYRNICPHYGSTLEWKNDAFLTPDGANILCSLHGALFRIEDRLCVHGPCEGHALSAIPVRLKRGDVYYEPKGATVGKNSRY